MKIYFTLFFLLIMHISMAQQPAAPDTAKRATDSSNLYITAEEEEMEEVIVQSTRTSRTIANEPTRVETIGLEEVDEKNNMRPGNVAMLLHESTGIQVQQTSATSGNASIRLQGLDGKYTQLLKDGYPNYGNFSSGLSVLQIPPLDLQQVEIIKGPASTLYGGGAIAGVVNFITKKPGAKPRYDFLLNQSSIGQTNAGAFIATRGKRLGLTVLSLFNYQKSYDADKDDFTEVPKTKEFTINPAIFFYLNERSTIVVNNSYNKGERTGGDVYAIRNKSNLLHPYFEKNNTERNVSTFEWKHAIGENQVLLKQSVSFYNRSIEVPGYVFSGKDANTFTDLSYLVHRQKQSIVIGGNYVYNNFNETSAEDRDNSNTTAGIFAQHSWDLSNMLKLESGLRVDVNKYKNKLYSLSETFVLPRVSLLINITDKLSSRIGGGLGYKSPTLFTEETESIQYRDVAMLNNVRSERSYGGTADLNFKTRVSTDLTFSINQLFFYTTIRKPVVLINFFTGYEFKNFPQPVTTNGFETNAKLIYRNNYKLFLGYTFNNAKAKYKTGNQFLTRVPRGKLNTALIYEKENNIKIGLEGYFTGRQYLSNGNQTPAFEELGFMTEKIFKKFSVFVNFENFTDTRQGRYKNVVNGLHTAPVFDEIWTHTEGFVFNGGIKLKL